MKKRLFSLSLILFIIFPFTMLLTACEFGDGENEATFTVTAPISTDDIIVSFLCPQGFLGSETLDDSKLQKAKLYEGKEVNVIIAFGDDYYYRYDVSNVEVKIDGEIVDLPEFTFMNNVGGYGCTLAIEQAISQNHVITIDTSNVTYKSVTYNMELIFKDLGLYCVDNTNINGYSSISSETFNNRFEFLRNNWSVKYKLGFETTWNTVSLSSITDSNSLIVPITLNLTKEKNLDEIAFKIRYGQNYEFSMNDNNIIKLGDQNLISERNDFDKVIYDADGYATYTINAGINFNSSQTTRITLNSPSARRKFKLNYNDYDTYFLMKKEYDESTYYTEAANQSSPNPRGFFKCLDYNMANGETSYFIGQTIEFKGAKGYCGNILQGSLPNNYKKYCFDKFSDYSEAKLFCKDSEIVADNNNVYSFTFTSELMEDGEFNFKFKGLKPNANGVVVKIINQSEYATDISVNHTVINEDLNYLLQFNVFPSCGNDCIIVPKNMVLDVVVNNTKSLSYKFNLIINGNRDTMQTSQVINGESRESFEPKLEMDLSAVSNKTGCDYIEITYEIITI